MLVLSMAEVITLKTREMNGIRQTLHKSPIPLHARLGFHNSFHLLSSSILFAKTSNLNSPFLESNISQQTLTKKNCAQEMARKSLH